MPFIHETEQKEMFTIECRMKVVRISKAYKACIIPANIPGAAFFYEENDRMVRGEYQPDVLSQ